MNVLQSLVDNFNDMSVLQSLVDNFNESYLQAVKTSKSSDWLDAALLGRQIICELRKQELVEDTLPGIIMFDK